MSMTTSGADLEEHIARRMATQAAVPPRT